MLDRALRNKDAVVWPKLCIAVRQRAEFSIMASTCSYLSKASTVGRWTPSEAERGTAEFSLLGTRNTW
jgi:hypothetical protein